MAADEYTEYFTDWSVDALHTELVRLASLPGNAPRTDADAIRRVLAQRAVTS
jgi:hypothetical protein